MTNDQKKLAQSLKSPDETLAITREEGYELTDKQLEDVAGEWGMRVCDPDECSKHDGG